MFESSNREVFEGEPLVAPFGHLEERVMEILWSCTEANVRDVVEKLERPLAYTTVMTTLDRLYKKGLLARRKESRAFIYSPRMSKSDWERERASGLVAQFLSGPDQGRELLLSTFLDAMGDLDEQLLEELEKKIRAQRRKLLRKSSR
jgi:predicted transcriptional regulator